MSKKEKTKEVLKDLMSLDKTVLVDRYAASLKPYVKIIYIVLITFLALFALVGLVSLLTGQISLAFIQLILVFVSFVIVRMFCEFLSNYPRH